VPLQSVRARVVVDAGLWLTTARVGRPGMQKLLEEASPERSVSRWQPKWGSAASWWRTHTAHTVTARYLTEMWATYSRLADTAE